MDAGFALLLPWLPVPASFVSFCGPSHGRPASGYHHCLLLTSTSGSILSRGHLASRLAPCIARQAKREANFLSKKEKKKSDEQTGPGHDQPAGRRRTLEQGGTAPVHKPTQHGPRSARQTQYRVLGRARKQSELCASGLGAQRPEFRSRVTPD